MNTSANCITITTKDCRLTVELGLTNVRKATIPFMLNTDPDELKEKAAEAFHADIAHALYMQSEPALKEKRKTEVIFNNDGTVFFIGILDAEEWELTLEEYNKSIEVYKEQKGWDKEEDESEEVFDLADSRNWFEVGWDPDDLFYENSGINEAIDLLAELMGWE